MRNPVSPEGHLRNASRVPPDDLSHRSVDGGLHAIHARSAINPEGPNANAPAASWRSSNELQSRQSVGARMPRAIECTSVGASFGWLWCNVASAVTVTEAVTMTEAVAVTVTEAVAVTVTEAVAVTVTVVTVTVTVTEAVTVTVAVTEAVTVTVTVTEANATHARSAINPEDTQQEHVALAKRTTPQDGAAVSQFSAAHPRQRAQTKEAEVVMTSASFMNRPFGLASVAQ